MAYIYIAIKYTTIFIRRFNDQTKLYNIKSKTVSEILKDNDRKLPLTLRGAEMPVPIYHHLTVASAQVKTALILSALNISGTSTIIESIKTRDHTENLLRLFGADIKITRNKDGHDVIKINGQVKLSPKHMGTICELIETPAGLKTIIHSLKKEPVIAVDLEADSMYHFQEKVCLIQMATPETAVVIDPLEVPDLTSLKPLFSDPDVRAALADTVLLQTDVTANDDEDKELLARFELYGPPACACWSPATMVACTWPPAPTGFARSCSRGTRNTTPFR